MYDFEYGNQYQKHKRAISNAYEYFQYDVFVLRNWVSHRGLSLAS